MDWFSRRPDGQARSTRSGRRPEVSEITEELLIGEYPHDDDILWLKERFAITAILSLQDDADLEVHGLDQRRLGEACREHGIRFVRSPIQDGSADAMAERLEIALRDLGELVVSGGARVYLHCNAGMNRAPTLAIAFLRAYRGMSLDEALRHVKARRACGPFMTVLEDYFGPRHVRPEK